MSADHRNRVPGGTYFFTVNLLDRKCDLLVTEIELAECAALFRPTLARRRPVAAVRMWLQPRFGI